MGPIRRTVFALHTLDRGQLCDKWRLKRTGLTIVTQWQKTNSRQLRSISSPNMSFPLPVFWRFDRVSTADKQRDKVRT